MATPEDLLSQAGTAGASIRRKPAWQTLRDRGISGQGSAAANRAKAAEPQVLSPGAGVPEPAKPPSVGAIGPGSTVGQPPPTPIRTPETGGVASWPGAAGGNPLRALRVGGPPPAPPPPDEMPTGPAAGVMALRALRGMPPKPMGGPTGEPPPEPPPALFDAGGFPMPLPGPGMTKPRFLPPGDGGLVSGAPPEPVQGGQGPGETPPWAGIAALMKPRRMPGALGDLGGGAGGGGGFSPENRTAY